MPDINIIATSSTERELRFYDTTANKWELRVLVSWAPAEQSVYSQMLCMLPTQAIREEGYFSNDIWTRFISLQFWEVDHPVLKMYYHFSQNPLEESSLILGDTAGNIRVLLFNPERKGPFREEIGRNLVSIRFSELLKVSVSHTEYLLWSERSNNQFLQGGLRGLRVVEFLNVHSDWVRQLSFYSKSNSFISCAPCPKTSVLMCDVYGTKSQYRYDVTGGVTCFCVAEGCVKST